MTTEEMSSWWESLDQRLQTQIVVEWPWTNGLSMQTFDLVPVGRRGDEGSPEAWAWRIPLRPTGDHMADEYDEAQGELVGCSPAFAEFLRQQVDKTFNRSA